MNTSLNRLNKELKAISHSHLQINDYHWGDFVEAINVKKVQYPLCCTFVQGNSFNKNVVPLQITIVIADKYLKNQRGGNLNDVESDTLQIARDFYEVINKSPRWNNFGRVDSASCSKFLNKGADECAGWILTIGFTLRDSQSICDLPIQGYDFESSSSMQLCADVIIINSDNTFSYVASSGETYILPNTTFTVNVNSVFKETISIPTLG
jgi:hypothetical protein